MAYRAPERPKNFETADSDDLPQTVCDAVWNALEGAEDTEHTSGLDRALESLQIPAHAAEIAALWLYDAEVRNGGHEQFFFSSWGAGWKLVRSGLARLGATDLLENFEGALAVMPDPIPDQRMSRAFAACCLGMYKPEQTGANSYDWPFAERLTDEERAACAELAKDPRLASALESGEDQLEPFDDKYYKLNSLFDHVAAELRRNPALYFG